MPAPAMVLCRSFLLLCALLPSRGVVAAPLSHCVGEFSLCPDGSCALVQSLCGKCQPGQYHCPLDSTCLHRVTDYATICQGLAGTHLDTTLAEEARLDYLVDAVAQNITELTRQLINNAPAIDRLGLPAYNYLNDDEHGVIGTAQATVFPMGVGMGASWSSETVHLVGTAIGVEARSTHNVLADKSGNSCGSTSTGKTTANGCGITLYAPNINLVRDPRWGRAEEVFGEDPHLTSELAVAIVTGMQGNQEGATTAADGGSLMAGACCKHYAVYSSEDIPVDRTQLNVNVSARSLFETYLPAMKACVTRAKATHVMCSYNAVNGKPTCAHDELLNDVLRTQWGFDGFVVSDYDAWINLKRTHHFVSSLVDAAAVGINAGMDQEGGFGVYSAVDAMPAAIAQGMVTLETVKRSLRRLMRIRLRLGMFDPPASVAPNNASYVPAIQCESAAHVALARRAVQESIVLLKNKGNVLPLRASSFHGKENSLAVIGPLADDKYVLLGAANYAFPDGPSKGVTTVLKGLQAALGESPVGHVDGCVDTACATADIEAATALSKRALATVLVLGDSFGGKRHGWPLCKGSTDNGCESEAHDRTRIELPGQQAAVAAALADADAGRNKTPLICVLLHGGAIALGAARDACDAIVDLWVPGQEAGGGLADVLFGSYSPSGRSPVTFYHATKDLPDFAVYDEYPSATSNGTTYRHYVGAPADFEFGFGLSYTTFSYANLVVPETAGPCDNISVSVTVTNTGRVTSDEVVQVYAMLPDATVPVPRIRLVAFQRVRAIPPGNRVVVALQVRPDSHAVVLDNGPSVYNADIAVQAGRLVLFVGGEQPDRHGGGAMSAVVAVSNSSLLRGC